MPMHACHVASTKMLPSRPHPIIATIPFVPHMRLTPFPSLSLSYTFCCARSCACMRVLVRACACVSHCSESVDGDLLSNWEVIDTDASEGPSGDVQTPREVYEDLQSRGYRVRYFRIPVTDERSPKAVDFDILSTFCLEAPEGATLVFNCQMGRGRTTTAMIVASLLQIRARWRHQQEHGAEADVPQWAAEVLSTVAEGVALSPKDDASLVSPGGGGGACLEDRLRAGDFVLIRSLLRVLEKGPESKYQIDAVIDACASFQNLRESIVTYRERFLKAASEMQRNNLQRVVIDYIERYFMLITFTSYLNTVAPDAAPTTQTPQQHAALAAGVDGGRGAPAVTFKEWLKQRNELYSIRERLLWNNPLSAMEVHSPADPSVLRSGALGRAGGASVGASDDQAVTDAFIASRGGYVLGSHTILKEDHFPGLQSSILRRMQGAPNFRQACEGLPVFGLSIPTVEGIRNVLKYIGVTPNNPSPSPTPNAHAHANTGNEARGSKEGQEVKGGKGGGKAKVMWFNMREEPVVYINGNPYVLREHARPFKNMQEYSKIGTARVESMEKRLKRDVVQEAEDNDFAVLVTRERLAGEKGEGEGEGGGDKGGGDVVGGGGGGGGLSGVGGVGGGVRVIDDEWERVDLSCAGNVATPAEVFQSLQTEGFPIDYVRIPVTDGSAPQLIDIDSIVAQAAFADPHTFLIFNCQGGAGRTTTGMVIGSLLHLRQQSKLASLPHSVVSSLTRAVSLPHTHTPPHVHVHTHDNSSNSNDPTHAPSQEDSEMYFDVSRDHGFSDDYIDSDLDLPSLREARATFEGSLKEGNYAVIQKLVLLVDYGNETKGIVDIVIDACGKLKNLRKAIFAYRRPRKSWGPSWGRADESVQGRHAAFRRGTEYLERYFILVAFACWLDCDHYHSGRGSFYEWFANRQDLKELKKTIRTNPGAALTVSSPALSIAQAKHSWAYEHRMCLNSRAGLILKKNTILKSYVFPEMQTDYLDQLPDVINYHKVGFGVPIATASAPTMAGMRQILADLGAACGEAHVTVVDLREEVVVYANGVPYVLREVNFATKPLNLAGISWQQVKQQELKLKEDLLQESHRYRGEILLHHEVSREGKGRHIAGERGERELSAESQRSIGASSSSFVSDITKSFDRRPDAKSRYLELEPFWESVDSASLSTPEELCASLQKEGFDMEYVRYPLSRERSLGSRDVEDLHNIISKSKCDPKAHFLFISHTGIGSGMRLAPLVVCCHYEMKCGHTLHKDVLDASKDAKMENRGILALTRVVPAGPECKLAVDKSIGLFSKIGDIRNDIHRCKVAIDHMNGKEVSLLHAVCDRCGVSSSLPLTSFSFRLDRYNAPYRAHLMQGRRKVG